MVFVVVSLFVLISFCMIEWLMLICLSLLLVKWYVWELLIFIVS